MEIRTQLLREFIKETIFDLGYDISLPQVFESYETAVAFGAIATRKQIILFLEANLPTTVKGV